MTSPVPDKLLFELEVNELEYKTELEDVDVDDELETFSWTTSDGMESERWLARANEAAVSIFFFVPRELEEELLPSPTPDDFPPSLASPMWCLIHLI